MSEAEVPFRQLHPASVMVNLLPRTWRVVRAAWPVLLVLLFGGTTDQSHLVDLTTLLLFFSMTVGSTIVHFLTLRYRVAEGRLEIKTGLLNRQVRVIDPKRIQNIEIVQNLFHRLSGLVEVRIETASGTEVEGLLSALSEGDGHALVAALSEHREREPTDEVTSEDVLFHNSLGDLLRFGATATRLGAGMLVAFGVISEAISYLQPDDVEDVGGRLSGLTMVLLGVGVVTGTWLVGIATSVVRHYDFRLLRRGGTLIAAEGLVAKRRVELGARKVQLVTIREPWLRRLLGFGSIHVETAAAREDAGGTVSAEAVVPLVDHEAFGEVLRHVLPLAPAELLALELHPPHPRAIVRRMIGSALQGLLLGALLALWIWPWGLLSLVVLLPLLLLTAWLDIHFQGWLVLPDVVIARRGYLDRRTTILPRRKLQSLDTLQGVVRQLLGLGQLNLRVAGSGVALPDLGWEESVALMDELRTSVASGTPRKPHARAATEKTEPSEALVGPAEATESPEAPADPAEPSAED